MNLSLKQLSKLRHLARLAGELNAEQRSRTDAYQQCLDYQAEHRYRITRLESELKRLAASKSAKKALEATRVEIESLKALLEQAQAEGQELQRSLEQARAFVNPMNATIDRLVKLAGTSRSALGISFSVSGARHTKPDIAL